MLSDDNGRPVHIPANPNKFQFDAEVARIFPDMAVRSIPNFVEAHEVHCSMIRGWIKPGARVLDIGASRGSFFKALLGLYPREFETLRLFAVDNSPDMCKSLSQDYPTATVSCADITSRSYMARSDTYDVVVANYVVQFLPQGLQWAVLDHICRSVAPGGVLIFGHKDRHHGHIGNLAHEQYIDFRVKNGYTREEIEAKTKALKGSMFPMEHSTVMDFVRSSGFSELQETFRFMMFNTFVARKGL